MRLLPWLRFFRVVNLPTVPGDVLAGASVAAAVSSPATGMARPLCAACLASVFMYMFGLAQNDIFGAKTDVGRPISEGLLPLASAKAACAVCWLLSGLVFLCLHSGMPFYAFAYVLAMTGMSLSFWIAGGVALVWTAYIWAVTKYSEGEEDDPAKKRCVGFLIGALVYLQLLVLLISYLHAPTAVTRGALLGGAAMLVALRFLKRCLPKVSAS